jgi:hypothetical protein
MGFPPPCSAAEYRAAHRASPTWVEATDRPPAGIHLRPACPPSVAHHAWLRLRTWDRALDLKARERLGPMISPRVPLSRAGWSAWDSPARPPRGPCCNRDLPLCYPV